MSVKAPDTEQVEVFCLGAGQEVGRSCILLRARGQHILLDCGAHLAYQDRRRFPDFQQLLRVAGRSNPHTNVASLTSSLDCVLLTHFHLDHSGALPLLTERHGYRGPLLMTAPTRALTPVILSDYWRLHVERRGVPESEFYSRAEIEACFQRVRCVQVHEEVRVNSRLSVQTHYAGHVLGAAMFLIRIDAEPECIRQPHLPVSATADRTISIDSSPALARAPLYILYSGDINHAADAHLGAFSLHRLPPALHPHSAYGAVSASAFQRATSMGFAQALQPNPQLPPHLQSLNSLSVLITESTYGGTIRDSSLTQERELLSLILECVLRRHGKALIPVFALGKAQQLCLLLESCWTRLGLQIPIFFAPGMAEQATTTFGLFADWGSQAVRDSTFDNGHNPYRFQHASLWRSEFLARESGPCVLFASPGMLQGGLALEVFRAWAPFESNAVIFPASCVEGTIGHLVQSGAKFIPAQHPSRNAPISGVDSGTAVRCRVARVALTVHADLSGIARLVAQTRPRHVVLVHGEHKTMKYLCDEVTQQLGIACHMPLNFQPLKLSIPRINMLPLSSDVLRLSSQFPTESTVTARDGSPPRKQARISNSDAPSLAARAIPLLCRADSNQHTHSRSLIGLVAPRELNLPQMAVVFCHRFQFDVQDIARTRSRLSAFPVSASSSASDCPLESCAEHRAAILSSLAALFNSEVRFVMRQMRCLPAQGNSAVFEFRSEDTLELEDGEVPDSQSSRSTDVNQPWPPSLRSLWSSLASICVHDELIVGNAGSELHVSIKVTCVEQHRIRLSLQCQYSGKQRAQVALLKSILESICSEV